MELELKKALGNAEERFNLAMKASNDGIFDWDLKTNKIYYSPGWKKMLGYEDHELPNDLSIWTDLTEPEDVKKSWDLQQKLISKQIDRFVVEFKMKHKDGHWVDILVRAEAVFNNDGKAIRIVGTHTDITERKQAEEALKESELMFRDLFEHGPIGIAYHKMVYDANGKPIDYLFLAANEAYLELTGVDPRGKLVTEAIPGIENDPFDWIGVFGKVALTGETTRFESYLEANQRWYDCVSYQNKPDCFVAAFLEITKRKKAEIKFQEITENLIQKNAEIEFNNERLQSLLSISQYASNSIRELLDFALGEAIKLTNSKIGYIYYYNENSKQFTLNTWSKGVMEECNVMNPKTVYDLDKTGCWGEAVRQRKPVVINDYQAENPIIKGTPHGHVQLEKFLTIPVSIDNEIVAVCGVANKATDYDSSDIRQLTLLMDSVWKISERMALIKELTSAKEKAEESDRLKSSFLANMSHEIRTPMNGILGFTELLLEPDLSSEEKEQYINIVNQSGQRMLNTVNDIIEISKIEAGIVTVDLKEVDVQARLDELIRFFNPEVTKKGLTITLKNQLPKTDTVISTDINKLDSILTNLIKNAIKFTGSGEIQLGWRQKAHFIEFHIKDTGIGIPKHRQEAIFNRFIQADLANSRVFEGSGLGLAIAKAHVEILGGKIWLESEEGLGSIFYFTLPLKGASPESKAQQLEPPIEKKGGTAKKLKILLVEDDEISYLHLSIVLKDITSKILYAYTGTSAVEMAQSNPDIDVILMDIRIPGIDGFEATRKIREFNKKVVIIAQTAFANTGDREKTLATGCNDYITKPVNKEDLLALINRYTVNQIEPARPRKIAGKKML